MDNSRARALSRAIAVALGGASALTMSMQPAAAGESASALEEVVVTAQRRTESLQDVPVAVSALSTEMLQSAGVQTFTDLQALTPSLAVVDGPAGRFINIRGVGLGVGTPFQTAGVPLHLDGAYVTNSGFFIRDAYYDLERVELYRGPQGTFAGQNSTGGAIFLVANQPNFDGLSGSVQQTIGDYEWFQTQGAVNLPISDNWAARVAFNWERRDSFTKNLGPQGPGVGAYQNLLDGNSWEPGNLNRRSMRAILRYKPSDSFDARLRYDFINDESDGEGNPRAVPLTFNDPDALPSARTINQDFPGYNNVNIHRAILNLQWQMTEGTSLKSVSTWQALENHQGGDTDGTSPYVDSQPLTPGDQFAAQSFGLTRTRDDYWFQEFDLVSTSDSALQWVVGAVGLWQHTPLFNTAGNYSVNNCSASVGGAPCTTWAILTPANPGNWLIYNQRHHSYAAFGEITYDFSDQFQLIVGGRYTYDEIELKKGSSVRSPIPPNAVLPACGGLCNVYGIGEFEEPTGRIAFNWFPGGTRDTTVYLSYNQGFKPGSFQTQFTLGAQSPRPEGHPPYKHETLSMYETGLKTLWLDGRVRTNVTGFFGTYEDYQASFRVAGQNIPRSQNIPESEIYGAELEIQAAFGDLRINANAGYTHSEITEGILVVIPNNQFGPGFPNAPATGVQQCSQVGGVLPCIDPVGLELNYAPQWTYNASVEYDFHLGDATLTPRLQYSFIDDQWVQLFHASQDFLPGHETLDFRLTYRAPEHWRVEGFVTNLTDELYVSGVTGGPPATPYVNALALGAPRQLGVRIQYDF